jgi:hypothetical protein
VEALFSLDVPVISSSDSNARRCDSLDYNDSCVKYYIIKLINQLLTMSS